MASFKKILDANGQQVGNLISLDGNDSSIVEVPISGKVYLVNVGRLAISGIGLPQFGHTSIDCSGESYIDTNAEERPLVPISYVGAPGWTIYVHDPAFGIQAVTIRSSGRVDNCAYDPDHPQDWQAAKLVPVVNLALLFQPPFTLG